MEHRVHRSSLGVGMTKTSYIYYGADNYSAMFLLAAFRVPSASCLMEEGRLVCSSALQTYDKCDRGNGHHSTLQDAVVTPTHRHNAVRRE